MNKRQKKENMNEFSLIPYYLIRHIYTNFGYRIDKLIHTFVGFTPRNKYELKNAVIEWTRCKINAENLFGHISFWNTQLITDMEDLFSHHSSFNENIGKWNVSNVVNMNCMFFGAKSFNKDLSTWDVGKVKDMAFMFCGAESFNQNISNWNVTNVCDMQNIFYDAHKFDQPLNRWNVKNVNDMDNMFEGAYSFNQPLNDWNVENVESMIGMFAGSAFNHPINDWNVSKVEDMRYMFIDTPFNQDINTRQVTKNGRNYIAWDVSNLRYAMAMFFKSNFNHSIYRWKLNNVDISNMFCFCKNFNKSLEFLSYCENIKYNNIIDEYLRNEDETGQAWYILNDEPLCDIPRQLDTTFKSLYYNSSISIENLPFYINGKFIPEKVFKIRQLLHNLLSIHNLR